jgi:4-amino-4-deoxy-L-arabinose transferase-like glycosyltransferase
LLPVNSRRVVTLAAVIGLLAVMEATMLLSVRQESQTADEAHNLFAGYLYLTRGDFSAGSAHPPLAKDVGALPLLALRPRVPPINCGEPFSINLQDGRTFLYANSAAKILFAARAAMTVFLLLLALLVYLATREMFGPAPALVALVLTAFEPNLLAHGALVTNDVALACCLFAAVYAFYRYLIHPTALRLAAAGLAGGLTLASKHSGLVLFPILFLLALWEWLLAARPANSRNEEGGVAIAHRQRTLRFFAALVIISALSVAVLWGFYGLRYAPVAGAPTPSLAPYLNAVRSRSKAAIEVAAQLRLLPLGYLAGLAHFLVGESRPTFLLGTRYAHGVWFYFPTALAIKLTLGLLLLLALAPFGLSRARERQREVLWMLIPAGTFLAASMTSNLNIGVRYIFPIFPFLIVLAAAGGWMLAKRHQGWALIVAGLVLLHAASSLRAFPNYLAYSNEMWGGPSETYRVLTDSNVDWGQGLPAVKRYLEKHTATPCWLAYFGTVDPAYYGIPCQLLTVTSAVVWGRPLAETPPVIEGTVFVSATEMSGQAWGPEELNPYEQFRTLTPVECLAGSILVYRGRFQVPLAAALSRLGEAVALANHGELDAAVAEVRAAESLAPHSVDVQFVLGRVLRAAAHSAESREAFANALNLARTIHPEWQTYWVPIIEGEMAKP